jgi:hypothetical protein
MRFAENLQTTAMRAMHLASGGIPVLDRKGEKVGVLLAPPQQKKSNGAAYAIICLGGCQRIGEELHPVPWDKLTYNPTSNKYVLAMTADQLRKAPIYTHDSNWAEQRWNNRLEVYYGAMATN